MLVECMCCETVLGERWEEEGVTSGICDPCMDQHYPKEAEKVKAYRTCETCDKKTLKCSIVACDELSRRLDEIDIDLKARGL